MRLAMITPSYAPDMNRCSLLSQSIDRWVNPSIDHIVIVPGRDKAVFNGLPFRSKVITVESILPRKVWQVPYTNRWWLTLCSLPVRGWIMQQTVKLAAAGSLDYDVFVFVDSDVVIIKQVTSDLFIRHNKVRLYEVPGVAKTKMHMRWHRKAAKLLGLNKCDYFGADYIGQMVSWYGPNVRNMVKRIEERHNRNWFAVLCNTLHFAEYILYGVYVDFVARDESCHFADDIDLCHCSWYYKIESPKDLEIFLDDLAEKHVAILIQSNLNIEVGKYYDVLKDRGLVN